MVDARVVANRFLHLAREQGGLTPMQVLKLVYIAHGWSLGLAGRSLIEQDVQAWQYGPVIPELYNAMRHFRADKVCDPLRLPAGAHAEELSQKEQNLVDQVYKLYGHLSGPALSRITHADGTPWSQTYTPGKFGTVISNDVIADHYERLSRERVPSGQS